MTRFEALLRRGVIAVGAYSPGASGAEIKARYGLREVIRLNWNENLFGPLPGVLEETSAALPDAWTYPEDAYEELRAAIATWTGARPEQVIPGHGIQALTLAVTTAFVEPGDVVIVSHPTYGLYAQAARVAGARVQQIDSRPDTLVLDLSAMAAAAGEHRAKLVWVCDPNNPTGVRLDAADWRAFLDALPEDCVAVVDEAYVDYIEPSERIDRLADIDAGRPLIVVRTFSKIFGLAGLRLGYALVHESLAPYLHTVHEPFNVNRAALAAGLASLERTDLLPDRRAQVRDARRCLVDPLRDRGIRALRSDANFVLLDLGVDDVSVCDALARGGLLLRAGSEFGLPGYARVTTAGEPVMAEVAERIALAVASERLKSGGGAPITRPSVRDPSPP